MVFSDAGPAQNMGGDHLLYPPTFKLCRNINAIDYTGLVKCPANVCLIDHQKTKLHAD